MAIAEKTALHYFLLNLHDAHDNAKFWCLLMLQIGSGNVQEAAREPAAMLDQAKDRLQGLALQLPGSLEAPCALIEDSVQDEVWTEMFAKLLEPVANQLQIC